MIDKPEKIESSPVLPKIKEFLDGHLKSTVKKGVDFSEIIKKLRERKRKNAK